MSINALVDMSNRYGENEEFVVCGGGNTSYKKEKTMYIKPSGYPLATIATEDFVAINTRVLIETLGYVYPIGMSYAEVEAKTFEAMLAAKEPGQEDKRPSVESILHALFPYEYVLHLHPAMVNGLTCSTGFEEICTKLFKKDMPPFFVCVKAMPPGPGLARECRSVFQESIKHNCNDGGPKCTDECRQTCKVHPQIAFLQNHGVFISADTVGEIDDIMTYIIDKTTKEVVEYPDFTDAEYDEKRAQTLKPLLTGLCTGGRAKKPEVLFFTNKAIQEVITDKESFAPVKKPLTPDQVLGYFDEAIYTEDNDDDIAIAVEDYIGKRGFAPGIIAVRGLGIYAVGDNTEKAENARDLFKNAVKIAVYAKSFGGINPLPEDIISTMLQFNPYA